MDIEGAEFEAFPDILKHANNITGIAIEIHFDDPVTKTNKAHQINKAIKLLSGIDQKFLLVHLHANNCSPNSFTTQNSKGEISEVLELTYINKSLVDRYDIAKNQSHPSELDITNCLENPDPTFEVLVNNDK